VSYIPLEEMFTSQELMDLRAAFDAVSMGQDFVDRESLMGSFQNLGIAASEEMLDELLNSMGQLRESDNLITFEIFARCVALLLEENADKVSTSSQHPEGDMIDEEDPDGYYNEVAFQGQQEYDENEQAYY
jgi:Ca2+-binding EF-hand superfamily protein